MKRLMIVFAALAAVACAKNNVAEDPAPAAQYLNLTISDFPALESATRSGETVGKTAWEDGDQLLIVFIISNLLFCCKNVKDFVTLMKHF